MLCVAAWVWFCLSTEFVVVPLDRYDPAAAGGDDIPATRVHASNGGPAASALQPVHLMFMNIVLGMCVYIYIYIWVSVLAFL